MSVRNSPFVQDSATGKRTTPWWLTVIAFAVIFLVFNFGGIFLLQTIFPSTDGSAASQVIESVGELLPTLAVFAWLVFYDRRRVASLGFHNPRRGVLALLLGIATGFAMISVPILILWAAGVYQTITPTPGSSTGFSALPIVVLLVLTVVVQGGNEEVLIRGFLFQNFGRTLPGWVAILAPSILFAVVHGVVAAPVPFITIFGYALFATFVVLLRKSLWLICGIHAGWNWAMGNVYGISVSGLPPEQNSIIMLTAAPGQPTWLSGGEWGAEGSLPGAFMAVTATVLVFLAWRRADRNQDVVASAPESAVHRAPHAEAAG